MLALKQQITQQFPKQAYKVYKMSIRFIGLESYVPTTPGKYTKNNTKIIKISTLPDQQDQKSYKMNKYKQELDKQVQQLKRRKLKAQLQQKQQDLRRQRLFYESLQIAKRHKQHYQNTTKNIPNYHLINLGHQRSITLDNPQYGYQDQIDDSRLAHMGKNKIKLDVPIFQSRSDLVNDQENYNEIGYSRKRKMMIQEMDRSLLDAHMAIERSRGLSNVDQEIDRLKRRLKTQGSRMSSQEDYQDQLYSLPYRSPVSRSPYRHYHKRETSWH